MTETGSASRSLFDGVSTSELESALEGLERRRYPAGAVVIAEGETAHELYILQTGEADVYVGDRQGGEHWVGRARAGATLGEMSLFTGEPAAGTVRALGELEVLVVPEADFERLSELFPRIFRNLGAILSERLASTNRLTVREDPGRLVVLRDHGAPPTLGYALSASLAWHHRTPTVLVRVGSELPEDLRGVPIATGLGGRDGSAEPRAKLVLLALEDAATPARLDRALEDLCARYDHVLVELPPEAAAPTAEATTLDLVGNGVGGGAGKYRVRGWSSAPQSPGMGRSGVVEVPEPSSADTASLREGVLPVTTPAGAAIGWVARDVAGLSVGVALGAGSLRGFAHFGVLRALERARVPIDYIAGTSIGACVAGIHALGYSPDEAIRVFEQGAPSLFRPTLSTRGFLSVRALRKFLQGIAGERRIEDLAVPLAMVAADLQTQREIVFRRGLVWQAALAAGAIPGLYPAQKIGPYMVIDGGVIDPVPFGVVADMGAGTVIGVKLSAKLQPPLPDAESLAAERGSPSAVSAILRSLDMMQSRLAPEPTDATTVVITPELADLPAGKLRSFANGARFVEAGEEALEAASARIAAALPWLRP